MFLKDPKILLQLLIGLIGAGLFTYVIQPLLNFCGGVLITLGSRVYLGLIDSIYQFSAICVNDAFSFLTYGLINALVVGWLAGLFIPSFSQFPQNSGSETFIAMEAQRENTRQMIYSTIGLSSALVLFTLLVVNYTEYQIFLSFEQRMTVLSPYLSEDKEEILQSKWAQMKNRNDYLEISRSLDSIAAKNKVKMPKRLWLTQ